jgi:hypothetical protein
MRVSRQTISDSLFVIQIVGAIGMGGTQLVRLLETTEGQLLSMFITVEVYLCMHLLLAIRAHAAQPSRVTKQSIAIYLTWFVMLFGNVAAFASHDPLPWTSNDTRAVMLVIASAAGVAMVARLSRTPLSDPMIRSAFAILCKSLPQIVMAFEIWQTGGRGLPGAAVVIGNFTITLRIFQVVFAVREADWERNRSWLLVSEIFNELSWALVSVVWFMRTF